MTGRTTDTKTAYAMQHGFLQGCSQQMDTHVLEDPLNPKEKTTQWCAVYNKTGVVPLTVYHSGKTIIPLSGVYATQAI